MSTTPLRILATLTVVAVLTGCSKHRDAETRIKRHQSPITGSSSDPAVEFTGQWKNGQRYAYYLNFVNDVTSPPGHRPRPRTQNVPPDEPIHSEVELGADFSLSVTNQLSNGARQIEYQLNGLEVNVAYAGRYTFNYDSENRAVPYDGPEYGGMRSLLNGRFTMDLNPKGRLARLNGARELVDNAAKAAGNARTAGRLFDLSMLKPIVEFDRMPAAPIRIGAKWCVTNDMFVGHFQLKSACTYHFKGWQMNEDRKCALFEFEGTLFQPDTKRQLQQYGATWTIENGKVSGRTWFDPALGAVTETACEQSYTLIPAKSDKPEKEDKSNPQLMPLPVAQSYELKLVDSGPVRKAK